MSINSAVDYEVALDILRRLVGMAHDRADAERAKREPDEATASLWEQRAAQWAARSLDLYPGTPAVQTVLEVDSVIMRSMNAWYILSELIARADRHIAAWGPTHIGAKSWSDLRTGWMARQERVEHDDATARDVLGREGEVLRAVMLTESALGARA